MKTNRLLLTLGVLGTMTIGTAAADDFTLDFDWGDIPRCTTGYPGVVPNPVFTLSGVPERTVTVEFRLRDLDAPTYRHGGGEVAYEGQATVSPGAFQYKSPCPAARETPVQVDCDGPRRRRRPYRPDHGDKEVSVTPRSTTGGRVCHSNLGTVAGNTRGPGFSPCI